MALNRLEKINAEVNVLMNEPVDGLWQVVEVNNVHTSGEHYRVIRHLVPVQVQSHFYRKNVVARIPALRLP
jgi:hypothetical protein